MAIEVFNRYEDKYRLDINTFNKVLKVMDAHMDIDPYCKNHSFYTISNIYYDTHDDYLIRTSLSKPVYKEKLRLRSYGVPQAGEQVYIEIKKKVNGLVNKRRTALCLEEAYAFLESGAAPGYRDYMNRQVLNELEYFMQVHKIMPKVYIAYDRLAYFEKGNDDLRISFDMNIRTRRYDLALEAGDYGAALIPENVWLMEIKTSRAMPIWLTDMLSGYDIRPVSFSKYGMEFKTRGRIQPVQSSEEKKYYDGSIAV